MIRGAARMAVLIALAATGVVLPSSAAQACIQLVCSDLEGDAATVTYEGAGVPAVVGVEASTVPDFAWRLNDRCVSAAQSTGYCSPTDVRACPPAEPGRVVGYFVVERRPIVRADLMYVNPRDETPPLLPSPGGSVPGDPVGDWKYLSEGCFDITALNPPPSPAEVFSYFERLPLPTLNTQHQPPGDGLSGLPVIFYTDSPTTQTFTVDIRGFTVVIDAGATGYTWHTGDPRTPTITSTDPGEPYPNQTVEHQYRSGTYTALLTVTWGATFSIDGSAPVAVPGSATTTGPAVTFDVLQARAVLTNPYD